MNLIKAIIASFLLVASLSLAKININTATVLELTQLKGIGEKKAQAIIAYRKENGRFEAIADLVNVKGIGEKTVNRLKEDLMLTGKTDLSNLKNAVDIKKSKRKEDADKPSSNKKSGKNKVNKSIKQKKSKKSKIAS